MRGLGSIARATALEILSEPLSLLILLAALALAVLAPVFHCHQFGEPTRMARDAGLSAIFTCGSALAVFGTVRTFRREIETGTMAMALAHPVSRAGFFLAKTAGAFAAYLVFAATVLLTALAIVAGAAVGGARAAETGDLARLWWPGLAAGVAVIVLPVVLGAALNRFARCRFVLSTLLAALGCSALAAGFAAFVAPGEVVRMLPAVPLAFLAAVLLVASAAACVRFGGSAAAACAGLVFVAFAPVIGNYYLADALSDGGRVPWSYVGLALLGTAPAVALFAWLGIHLINGRDIT